jgi:transcriptional regulator with XRE-family HTH domain
MSTDVASASDDLSSFVIGEILALMGRRRMSNAELGRRLEEPDYWVGRRLNGKIPIDLHDLQRIAVVLGVSVTDLMPRSGKEPTAQYLAGERLIATIGDHNRETRPHPRRRSAHRTRQIVGGSIRPLTPVGR